MSVESLQVRALRALYEARRGVLGTTAGFMMSGDEAMALYSEACEAREALAIAGVELPNPTDDPWINVVMVRARQARAEGRGHEHYAIGPGFTASRP